MKRRTKMIVAIGTILVTNLIVPLLIVRLAPAEWGMGLCILLFFAGIPVMEMYWGVLAGSELKKLWWIPVAGAFSFPILFSLAVWGPVWELFLYSIFYALIGGAAMAVAHYAKQYKEKHK